MKKTKTTRHLSPSVSLWPKLLSSSKPQAREVLRDSPDVSELEATLRNPGANPREKLPRQLPPIGRYKRPLDTPDLCSMDRDKRRPLEACRLQTEV